MDKAGYLKHKEVIEAWANGAEIEWKCLGGEWRDCPVPEWFENLEYRIKPKEPVKSIEKRHVVVQVGEGIIWFDRSKEKDPNIAFTFNAETGELLDVEKL